MSLQTMERRTSFLSSERTLFLGPLIPNNIKTLPKHLSTVNKPLFRSLVKLAVSDLEGKHITQEIYQSKIIDESNLDIDALYGAIYTLLRIALSISESSLKQEAFKDDLRELKIPEEYIEDLANAVYGPRRSLIESNFINTAPHLQKLKKFKWRVDVAISTSSLNRVLEPTIIMEMETTSAQQKTFQVNPSEFHQLRYAVSTLLKEMENLEKKSVMK